MGGGTFLKHDVINLVHLDVPAQQWVLTLLVFPYHSQLYVKLLKLTVAMAFEGQMPVQLN